MRNDYEIRDGKVLIVLNRNDGSTLEAVIDVSDFEKVSSVSTTWGVRESFGKLYVWTRTYVNGKKTTLHLHRFIMDCPDGFVVDHRDGNGLLNTRKNLRVVTQAQNLQNRTKLQRTNTSGIRGVSLFKRTGKWQAKVKIGGKQKHIGFYSTPEEARIAVEDARSKLMTHSTN